MLTSNHLSYSLSPYLLVRDPHRLQLREDLVEEAILLPLTRNVSSNVKCKADPYSALIVTFWSAFRLRQCTISFPRQANWGLYRLLRRRRHLSELVRHLNRPHSHVVCPFQCVLRHIIGLRESSSGSTRGRNMSHLPESSNGTAHDEVRPRLLLSLHPSLFIDLGCTVWIYHTHCAWSLCSWRSWSS